MRGSASAKLAEERFDSLGGIDWLRECHSRYMDCEPLVSIAKDFEGVNATYLSERFRRHNLDTKRLSRKVPKSKFKDILSMWDNLYSVVEIAETLKVDYKATLALLKVLGRDTADGKTNITKRGVNVSFFDEDTEGAAYFYGLILADGNLSDEGTVVLTLQERDGYIVERMASEIRLNSKVYTRSAIDSRTGTKSVSRGISFRVKDITRSLERLGLRPRKSNNEIMPSRFADDRHFWRGMVDGDGSIKKGSIVIANSKEVCQAFCKFAKSIAPDITAYVKDEGNIHLGVISKKVEALKVMHYLYSDCSLYLTRKKDAVDKQVKACSEPELIDWVSNCRNPDVIRSKLSKINSCCDNRLGYLLGLGALGSVFNEEDCPC